MCAYGINDKKDLMRLKNILHVCMCAYGINNKKDLMRLKNILH